MGLGGGVVLVGDVGLAVGEKGGARGVEVLLALRHHVEELLVAHGDGVPEDVHLRAVVVDVVLALDLVAGVLEHAAERVAQGSPAAVPDVERPHGVGGDKLHLDLGAVAHLGAGIVAALLAHGAEDLVGGGGGEVEVDEAGAGDLHVIDRGVRRQVRDDGVSDLARRAVRELRGAQGDRGAPVTVGGVGGALEAELGHLELRQVPGLLGGCDSGSYELLDLLGHGFSPVASHCWQLFECSRAAAAQMASPARDPNPHLCCPRTQIRIWVLS